MYVRARNNLGLFFSAVRTVGSCHTAQGAASDVTYQSIRKLNRNDENHMIMMLAMAEPYAKQYYHRIYCIIEHYDVPTCQYGSSSVNVPVLVYKMLQ